MIRDALGDRMKKYEAVSKSTLVSRMPVIIRLDGVAFHTFCRGFKKPFDPLFSKTMQATMKYLCENIQGCILGYTQSDEITLVLIDYKKLNSSAWFDNEVQKICSVSAALATYAFNKYFNDFYLEQLAEKGEADALDLVYDRVRRQGAYFDSRAFNVPREEVTNCILWRQLDAERNSVNALAQSLFSHKSLQGLNIKDTKIKIEQEKGIVWGELPTTQKRGSCCIKDIKLRLPDGQLVSDRSHIVYGDKTGEFYWDGDGYYFYATGLVNNPNCMFTLSGVKLDVKVEAKWIIDNNIPRFVDEGREYVDRLIYPNDEEE